MANSGDSGATWADIVKTLMDTFLLLRDIFGYALPGMVFAGIGVASGRIQVQHIHNLLLPYDPPMWVLAGLGIAACYVIGHVLACMAYLRIDLWKYYQRNVADYLKNHPTDVNPDDLYWRHFYPDLFHDLDRRETMSLLMYSTSAAMVAGYVVFCWLTPTFGQTILGIAVFVILDGLTTMAHLRRTRAAIHEAGPKIQATEAQLRVQASADAAKKPADGI